MHRCTHASRAIENIIGDVTRLNIRQQRAQRFFQQCRGFRTRPPVQQLEPSTTSKTDGASIPFLHEGVKLSEATAKSAKKSDNSRLKVLESEDGTQSDEWHAEIEVVAPVEESHNVLAHNAGSALEDGAQQETRSTADSIATGESATTADRGGQDHGSSSAPKPAAASGEKTRAESRQDRKLRRMKAGTYRAASESRTKQEMVDYQVEHVLHKLDEEVDGPRQARAKALERFKKRESIKEGISERRAAKSDKVAPARSRQEGPKPKKETWQVQKAALENKFGETGWQPRKRLSPDTLEGIRALHASDPAAYSTETLSEHFKVTPEAIRRILKSKWRPDEDEADDRRNRWERRGVKKWQEMAEQGTRPPAKWRAMGVGSEEGPKEDRIPKRRKRSRNDGHLSWDEVVGEGRLEEDVDFDSALAERIL